MSSIFPDELVGPFLLSFSISGRLIEVVEEPIEITMITLDSIGYRKTSCRLCRHVQIFYSVRLSPHKLLIIAEHDKGHQYQLIVESRNEIVMQLSATSAYIDISCLSIAKVGVDRARLYGDI